MTRASSLMRAAVAPAFALASASAFAQQSGEPNRYGYGPYMMDWGGGYGMMLFGPLFMLLFLVVLIAVAVVAVRGFGGSWQWPPPAHPVPPPAPPVPPGRTALDILKERYARGEIDKQEFEERRRVLGE